MTAGSRNTRSGLIGLAVGIAFRDITENFLVSIFLSIQHLSRQPILLKSLA